MVRARFQPEDHERLFASLRRLVAEAEAAYVAGNPTLARHATANLAFATQLLHTALKTQERVKV